MRYEILLEKLFNGWDCCYNIRKTCGCVKPKKSNFKKLPILALELTKTEWKKKANLSSRLPKFFYVHVLLLVHFLLLIFKTHTLFLCVQVQV